MKNKYLSTSLGLYMNYFVHGMALIIIAQNIDFLSQKWHTDLAGAAGVVSSFGIGKLLAVFISGRLSDKFGRKLSVILGVFFLYYLFRRYITQPQYDYRIHVWYFCWDSKFLLRYRNLPRPYGSLSKKKLLLLISLLKLSFNLVNSFYHS